MKAYTLLLSYLVFTSCTTIVPIVDNPTRHLLESTIVKRSLNNSSPSIAISYPSLPPYLERPELVTRTHTGRTELHQLHVWSEPLDTAITRVLAENLRYLTGSTNIQPVAGFISRDYDQLIKLRIDRFDPDFEKSLLLECTWNIQDLKTNSSTTHPFETKVTLNPLVHPMSARIKAMNEGLAQLAQNIEKSLSK